MACLMVNSEGLKVTCDIRLYLKPMSDVVDVYKIDVFLECLLNLKNFFG